MAEEKRVLFVCLHGAAKSVIASEYLRRMADGRGLAIQSASAGVEPDDAIPPHVVAGLAADGFDVVGRRPRTLREEMLADADVVVSFGCDLALPHDDGRARRLVQWDDVPAVSDGYETARDAIVRRVDSLVREIER
jgi:protein-tyrosine-phosphatase